MTKKLFEVVPRVRLIAMIQGDELGPEELVAFSARSTIKKEDIYRLYNEAKERGEIERLKKHLLDITIGSGHIDVLDQAVFTLMFRDIPRLTTLFLVSLPYLSHLQQSMRYVEPYKIYIPEELREEKQVIETMERSILLYRRMVESGIPKEDARYVLPLYTVTNIVTTGNAREITHLYLLSMDDGIPDITSRLVSEAIHEISKRTPNLFKDRIANYDRIRYYPAAHLFTRTNEYIKKLVKESGANPVKLLSINEPFKLDEETIREGLQRKNEAILSILKNISYTFITKMSIVTYHQAIRQRTWNHTVESLYDSLEREEYIIPPSIRTSTWCDKFVKQIKDMYKMYHNLVERGYKPTIALGIVSHAHTIYDIVKIDAWNYVGALPLRRCLRAQWEIRKIVTEISRYISKINPALGKYSMPPCRVYGICNEKRPCKYHERLLSMKPYIS